MMNLPLLLKSTKHWMHDYSTWYLCLIFSLNFFHVNSQNHIWVQLTWWFRGWWWWWSLYYSQYRASKWSLGGSNSSGWSSINRRPLWRLWSSGRSKNRAWSAMWVKSDRLRRSRTRRRRHSQSWDWPSFTWCLAYNNLYNSGPTYHGCWDWNYKQRVFRNYISISPGKKVQFDWAPDYGLQWQSYQ